MSFIAGLVQKWIRRIIPKMNAHLCRVLYSSRNVEIGKHLLCDGVPRCLIDSGSTLQIGNNVEFRSGVEIRVHGTSRLIIEDNVRIDRGVRLLASNCAVVRIGAGSRIGLYSVLNGGDSIDIDEKVLVSGFVYLQTSMHKFSDAKQAIRDQGYEHGPIKINKGAWLAAHVVVMPGVSIGSGAIVGSNAVVTSDVGAGAIVVGIPAKSINQRNCVVDGIDV